MSRRAILQRSSLLALAFAAAPGAFACAQAISQPQAAPQPAGQTVLQGDAASVSLATTAETPSAGHAKVGGAISYVAKPVDALTTRVDVNLKGGDGGSADGLLWPGAGVDPARQWTDLGVGLSADWAARPDAQLKLNVTDRVLVRPVSPEGFTAEADAPTDSRVEQGAAFGAVLHPAPQLGLDLGAEIRTASDSVDMGADDGGRAVLRTRDDGVHATLDWAILPTLKLQAGGRVSSTQSAWVEGAVAAQTFSAVQPDVTATLIPWSGSALALGVTRAVTPLDAGKFVTLARASAVAADTDLRPDQEWRLQARLTQALPDAGKLELDLTQAALESSTELMRVGPDLEAPGSVEGGRRSQVDLNVALPLGLAGLPSLALQTRGVWRVSEIVDPVTHEPRRLSGESPYETNVALVQTLGARGLSWGVNTHGQGAQSYYGLSQLSSVTTDPSLGAFVEYRPSTLPTMLAVRLQLDNLVGGERRWTDAFYVDGRDTGDVQHVDHREDGGPAFTLSLHRAL